MNSTHNRRYIQIIGPPGLVIIIFVSVSILFTGSKSYINPTFISRL
jgi:hypothetical protein